MSQDAPTRAAIIAGCANVLAIAAGLIGVFANLVWNRKKHQDERSYNLRRDVYLESIAASSRSLTFLRGKAIPLSDDKKEAARKEEEEISTQLSGAYAKLHILGGKRVVSAAIAFQSRFEEMSTKADQHLRAFNDDQEWILDDLPKKADHLRETINADAAQKSDAERILTEFAENKGDQGELRKEAERAAKVYKDARKHLNEHQHELDSLVDEVMGVAAGQWGKLGAAVDFMRTAREALAPLLTELTVAMKTELGIPIGIEWYKKEMRKALDDSIQLTAHFFEPTTEDIRRRAAVSATRLTNLRAKKGQDTEK